MLNLGLNGRVGTLACACTEARLGGTWADGPMTWMTMRINIISVGILYSLP